MVGWEEERTRGREDGSKIEEGRKGRFEEGKKRGEGSTGVR